MFRLLDRHVFKQLLGPFVFGLLGALIIIAFGPMNKAIKFLLKGQVPPKIVLEWFLFRVPEDMQFIFPVASLMATLLGFASLSKNGELTAMRAAGISLTRLLIPVVAFGLLTSGATYYFLNRFVPPAMVRSQDLWVKHFRSHSQEAVYKENFTLKAQGGRLVSVGLVNLKKAELRRLIVRDYPHGLDGPHRTILAPRANWDAKSKQWVLENARIDDHLDRNGTIKTQKIALLTIDLTDPPEIFQAEERTAQELTPEQLLKKIRNIESRGLGNTLAMRVDLYLKSSFPFCVFLFALLGATMGITNSRAGGFMGFGIALLLTFLYYVVMSLSASLGKSGTLSPLLAAWLHNGIFFLVVCYKSFQASNS